MNRQSVPAAPELLAVDLGLRMGWAQYGANGRLLHYGAHNFGARKRLRNGCKWLLNRFPGTQWLVLEGGDASSRVWKAEAERRKIQTLHVGAETWREVLLPSGSPQPGAVAKGRADTLARSIIGWSEAKRPTTLRHDAAEAICLGLWGVLEIGWLDEHPFSFPGPSQIL